jgi:predicted phosphodiesterase
MAGRLVIFSDTHLGNPQRGAGAAETLRPLWQGAEKLILNGDLAELADPKWRARAARQVLLIEEFCQRDGVQLEVLSGNHDPQLSDRRHLSLFGGALFVTHGDALHPAISPWNSYAGQLRQMHDRALASLVPTERAELQSELAAAQHASHLKWEDLAAHEQPLGMARKLLKLPPTASRVLWYWLTMPERAAAFADRHAPAARFFVFGHYHRSGVWRRRGRTIINTGAFGGFLPPCAVVVEAGRLQVYRIARRDGLFHLAPHPRVSFDLLANDRPVAAAAPCV